MSQIMFLADFLVLEEIYHKFDHRIISTLSILELIQTTWNHVDVARRRTHVVDFSLVVCKYANEWEWLQYHQRVTIYELAYVSLVKSQLLIFLNCQNKWRIVNINDKLPFKLEMSFPLENMREFVRRDSEELKRMDKKVKRKSFDGEKNIKMED